MSEIDQVREILESWNKNTLIDIIINDMPDDERRSFIQDNKASL